MGREQKILKAVDARDPELGRSVRREVYGRSDKDEKVRGFVGKAILWIFALVGAASTALIAALIAAGQAIIPG